MRVMLRLALMGGLAAWVGTPGLVLGHGNELGVATATVGGGKVTVEYAGPQLKGRDVMAMLQPGIYWRMGADKPTIMTTEADLIFGGQRVAKGKYTLAAHFLADGKWSYFEALGRYMDKGKFEGFKSRFYELEGWETATGYPTRSTLESLGLGYVADVLEKKDRLGGA